MKNVIFILISFFFAIVCYGQDIASQQFMNAFEKHVGMYYEGRIVAGGKEGDGFVGERLLMQVKSWDARQIKVPFYVGEDKSRTWVFTLNDNLIELKHDHRLENGMPEEVTFYGGTATNEGWKDMQMFPADSQTCELIDYACFNVWWVTINEEKFTYNLRRIGTDRLFSVEFDLTKSVESEYMPW